MPGVFSASGFSASTFGEPGYHRMSRPHFLISFRAVFRAGRRHAVGQPLPRRLSHHRGGSVSLIAALAMTVLCGILGLAIDVGLWYRTTRAMQNAADAAAIAAARDGTSTYQATGKGV